jgi:hypothetical protein
MFTGKIEGVGPRYCPSVEDKINRFADKDSHQIFLEPEGLTTHEVYPNGISTSLPFDIQYALVRSMVGLENAHILRPGYAIEYDFFDPRGLKASLETGGAAPAANCMGNCAQQWPTPPGCDPAAPTVYCCQVQAERDYCQSLCRCEGSVLPSTCRAVAAAEYVVDWMNCSMLDEEIF